MAKFYAEIMGGRGKASRTGTEKSAMWSHTRGWDSGIEINCEVIHGRDVIDVYATKGSSGGYGKWKLGTLEQDGTFILSRALKRKIKNIENSE